LDIIPENAIVTPHLKEFERLIGKSSGPKNRLQLQMDFSKKYKIITVLKGANTCISMPDGEIFINTTGNPGMATAGSGDVLTGIILALLAQTYTPIQAALMGVYVHGLAGDIAVNTKGEISLIASDLVDLLGDAFLRVSNFS
jgi:ADP-dependent NAD(P)H-hydrate dehydratase / NAD(P)H-hydrate epimerase